MPHFQGRRISQPVKSKDTSARHFLCLLFDPEVGGNAFSPNVEQFMPDYTAWHTRELCSSGSQPWEPEIQFEVRSFQCIYFRIWNVSHLETLCAVTWQSFAATFIINVVATSTSPRGKPDPSCSRSSDISYSYLSHSGLCSIRGMNIYLRIRFCSLLFIMAKCTAGNLREPNL
jgi:hypothetical protein